MPKKFSVSEFKKPEYRKNGTVVMTVPFFFKHLDHTLYINLHCFYLQKKNKHIYYRNTRK